jgi:MFS family permease
VAPIVFLAVALSLIPHDMQYGPQAALIAESFPTRMRYSGAGLGYQFASVLAGGPVPLVATWLLHQWGGYAVATYVALTGVVSLLALARLPERARVDLEQLDSGSEPARGLRGTDGVRASAPARPRSRARRPASR